MELALKDPRVRVLGVLGIVDPIQQAIKRFIRWSGSVNRSNYVCRYQVKQ